MDTNDAQDCPCNRQSERINILRTEPEPRWWLQSKRLNPLPLQQAAAGRRVDVQLQLHLLLRLYPPQAPSYSLTPLIARATAIISIVRCSRSVHTFLSCNFSKLYFKLTAVTSPTRWAATTTEIYFNGKSKALVTLSEKLMMITLCLRKIGTLREIPCARGGDADVHAQARGTRMFISACGDCFYLEKHTTFSVY